MVVSVACSLLEGLRPPHCCTDSRVLQREWNHGFRSLQVCEYPFRIHVNAHDLQSKNKIKFLYDGENGIYILKHEEDFCLEMLGPTPSVIPLSLSLFLLLTGSHCVAGNGLELTM